jgi:AcrR family transcriptional regulator
VIPSTRSVKTRSYDSSRRRADARARRETVLGAARELFLRDGFAGTTVAAIADRAEVSAEMVYKTFGGKAGLIEALYRQAVLGSGDEPAFERSDRLRGLADPREILFGWSRLSMEVGPRVTAIQLLVRDAALVDGSARRVLAELDELRMARMRDNAQHLHDAGHLRAGVGVEEAADLMWSVTAPEMVELLVHRRGWRLEQFADFVYETLSNALLTGPAR